MSDKNLVDRLNGVYRIPITDGLGAVKGGDEPDNPNEFVRTFPVPPIHKEAAAAIERLTRERDEEHAALVACDRQLGLFLNGTQHEALQDLCAAANARAASAEARVAELTRERDEARDEAYALKYAAAGGEDAPGAAHAVTVADVEQWQKEGVARERASEARVKALEGALRRMLLEFDLLIESGRLPDIRNDIIFVKARAALEAKP